MMHLMEEDADYVYDAGWLNGCMDGCMITCMMMDRWMADDVYAAYEDACCGGC